MDDRPDLHALARRHAHALREQALDDAFAAVAGWCRRGWRRGAALLSKSARALPPRPAPRRSRAA